VYLYDGEQFDPSVSAYYLRARYYDMALGSFFSADPLGGVAGHPLSFQRYLYADADPLNHGDPSGKQTELVGLVAGLSIAAQPEPNQKQANVPQAQSGKTFEEAIDEAVSSALKGIDKLLHQGGAINSYFVKLPIAREVHNPDEYSKIISKIYDVLYHVFDILDNGVVFFREQRHETADTYAVEREAASNTIYLRKEPAKIEQIYIFDVALGAVLFYVDRGSSTFDLELDVGAISPLDIAVAIYLAATVRRK
jgi:RHS repeat-associated protein